ncbi:MAG: cytochrome c3 family protein [Thermodesulfobacteriota bacterium]
MNRTGGFFVNMAALCWLGTATPLPAQEVPHHDFLVNIDDGKACLTCHDGAIARNITICARASCLFEPHASHPVFRKYPPAGKEDLFFPAARVEAAGIRLTNGEVSCLSCHNLLNKNQFHLVIDNVRSRLCMSCHIR